MKIEAKKILLINRKSIAGNNRESMSVRIRLAEPFRYLASKKFISLEELNEDQVSKSDIINADLIAISRSYSLVAVSIMEMAKQLSKPILYDVDDDMFVLPKWTSLNTAEFENHKKQLELANVITVSHPLLADRITFVGNKIHVIQTGTLIQESSSEVTKHTKKIVYTNLMDIKLENARSEFLRAISDFMKKNESFELDVFSDSELEICEIKNVNYCGFLEYNAYRKALISRNYLFAISPLSGYEDLESILHNECKSPIKYIDYSAAKIPGIYSDSPAYRRVVKEMENGLLVKNTYDAWIHALELLRSDSNLRNIMAKNAYQDVQKNYNTELLSMKWFDLVQKVLS